MPVIRIDSDTYPVQSLFSEAGTGSYFEVRPPQRRYKWKANQVTQFWDDIVHAFDRKQPSYFLGTVLLQRLSNKNYAIIDGQQRLATLGLLVALLRDECSNNGLPQRAARLHELIVRTTMDGVPTGPIIVTLQPSDDQVYQRLVRNMGDTSISQLPSFPKNDRLYPALKTLKQRLSSFIQGKSDPKDTLSQLTEYVCKQVKLLPIEVVDESQAYLVFDTTNTRGLRLTPAEELKARLAVVVRDNPDLAKEFVRNWNQAALALEQAQLGIDAMDNFLLVLWSSRHGYTTLRRLATAVTRALDSASVSPEAIAKDIAEYAKSYTAVVSPSGNDLVSQDLRDLKSLRLTQANAFLTMVHKHDPTSFPVALSTVLTLQIRNLTVGEQQANVYQNLWPHWARFAREGRTDEALKEIKANLQTDKNFQNAFATRSVSDPGAMRHILRRLDLADAPHGGMQPSEVDVEHVLPKAVVSKLLHKKRLTPNVIAWITNLGHPLPSTDEEKERLGKQLNQYLNRIGNQALVHQTPNRATKDKPFQDKRTGYKEMKLTLTQRIGNRNDWNTTTIDEHQRYLAEVALKAWPS